MSKSSPIGCCPPSNSNDGPKELNDNSEPHQMNQRIPKITITNRQKLTIHNKITTDSNGKRYTSWQSILRDLLMTIIPIFVLYKISTHPIVARMGNTPKKPSREEQFHELMRNLYLKRKKSELEKQKQMLDDLEEEENKQILADLGRGLDLGHEISSVDIEGEGECYATKNSEHDSTVSSSTITEELEMMQQEPKIKTKYRMKRKYIPSNKKEDTSRFSNQMKGQIKKRRASLFSAPKLSSPPSSPPWSSSITSAIAETFATGSNNMASKGEDKPGQAKNRGGPTGVKKVIAKRSAQFDEKGVRVNSWQKFKKRH